MDNELSISQTIDEIKQSKKEIRTIEKKCVTIVDQVKKFSSRKGKQWVMREKERRS